MISRNLVPSRASRIFDSAGALAGLDRQERDAVARLDERQRRRGGRREPVRDQVEELAQDGPPRAPEARRQVRDLAAGHVGREGVQQAVADATHARGLGVARARADDEVVLAQPVDDPTRVLRPVLAVAVDDEHPFPGRGTDAGLDGGAIALVVRMAQHAGAGGFGRRRGLVRRPVVHEHDLEPRRRGAQGANHVPDDGPFVVRGDEDGNGLGGGHDVRRRAGPRVAPGRR